MDRKSADTTAPAPAYEPPPHSWLAVAAGLAVCAIAAVLLVLVAFQHLKTRPVNLREHTLALADEVEQVFRGGVVYPENIRRSEPRLTEDERASWFVTAFEVDIDGQEPEGLETILNREMVRREVTVTAGECSATRRQLHLSFAGRRFAEVGFNLPAGPPQPEIADDDPVLLNLMALAGVAGFRSQADEPVRAIPRRPVVAVILDDGGYGGPVTDEVLKLDPRLTLAILPGAPHSAETARLAAEAGFEVLLHLPMESPEDPGWIGTSTPSDEMRRLLDEALERVPGAAGINNHMGSTFCRDVEALGRFFAIVKERPLFFVDSRTTHETVIPQAAREAGVPVAERKVFLDNEAGETPIREQFEALAGFAVENGTAVAIGHFRPETVSALKALLPELEKRGINLVHVSEVVQ